MTPRMVKEIRALSLPWMVALLAAVALPLVQQWKEPPLPKEFLLALSLLSFFSACVLMAALSFGNELHQHTLGLLLSQPLERSRLWREKLQVLALAVGSAAATFALLQCFLQQGEDVLLPLVFLVGLVGSAGFWTFCARSVIGGAAFAVSAQLFQLLLVKGILEWCCRPQGPPEGLFALLATVTGLPWAAAFQYLGWRKFARLELADLAPGDDVGFLAGRIWPHRAGLLSSLLRCRSAGCLRNLLRKELCLQRPAALVSSLFVLAWLVVAACNWVRPDLLYLFDVLVAIQIPLVLILVPTVAVGEEKGLGVTAWQLTQPVSAWSQWSLKLAVSLLVALALAWGLPSLFTWLTFSFFPVAFADLPKTDPDNWIVLALATILLFGFAFWAATLVASTTRAALTALLASVGCLLLAGSAFSFTLRAGGWETGLLTSLVARFHLDPDAPARWGGSHAVTLLSAASALFLLLLLAQSFARFRRAPSQDAALLKYSSLLGLIAVGLGLWGGDFVAATHKLQNSSLQAELAEALLSLPDTRKITPGRSRPIKLEELARTDKLSKRTQTWLEGTAISIAFAGSDTRRSPAQAHPSTMWRRQVFLVFPSGRQYSFGFPDPIGPRLDSPPKP